MNESLDFDEVTPKRAAHYRLILDALAQARDQGKPGLTRCELERWTGLRINSIAGRVGELLEMEAVHVVGMVRCEMNGHNRDVEQLTVAGHLRPGKQATLDGRLW